MFLTAATEVGSQFLSWQDGLAISKCYFCGEKQSGNPLGKYKQRVHMLCISAIEFLREVLDSGEIKAVNLIQTYMGKSKWIWLKMANS